MVTDNSTEIQMCTSRYYNGTSTPTMVTDNSTKILIAFMYIVTITETYQKTFTNTSTQELFLYMCIL